MRSLMLTVLLLSSSLSFAREAVLEGCDVPSGASSYQVERARHSLELAGVELNNLAGSQDDAIASLNRFSKAVGLTAEQFNLSKSLAVVAIKQNGGYLHSVAAGCDRTETVDYFNAATQMIDAAIAGLRK
jgi:peptide deformylase